MPKKLTKRPLQEQQNEKRPDKRLKISKDQLELKNLLHKPKDHTEKMQKISFDDPSAGEETEKSNFDKTKKRQSKSVKYARKEGEKAPGVLEKRRERKQQIRKQRKNQKQSRKEAKTMNKLKENEDKRPPLKMLDDLLTSQQPLNKEQFK